LAHLLEDWNRAMPMTLQVDADLQNLVTQTYRVGTKQKGATVAAEKEPTSMFFNCWMYTITVKLMLHYLELGFELELYHPREYLSVFWYLESLYGCLTRSMPYAFNQHTRMRTQSRNSSELPLPMDFLVETQRADVMLSVSRATYLVGLFFFGSKIVPLTFDRFFFVIIAVHFVVSS
jgi:hypothetical protein